MRDLTPIIAVFSYLFITVPVSSLAADSALEWGRVNMQGSIIDTACAIAVESQDQTVEIDAISVEDIVRDGQGRGKNFYIKLSDCELDRFGRQLPDLKNFQVTFDGDSEGGLFTVQGTVSGVALKISDLGGNIARPGKPLPLETINPQSMVLSYAVNLVANNHILTSGEYFSAIRFKLDYF
ncbi:PAP fimbrial minor pilin protein precursor [Serratia fonticola]|uniref:fimbrial protein n=1 Tax=Serratia fonticola TaxID=47917 RepID=UPI0021777C4E|nr:fimbrial protein [Serratia fonticola]CAI1912204.1 PAP fimbrial minor pilin protein precursor [Serratia fonticola]